jgi:hypothetical protein
VKDAHSNDFLKFLIHIYRRPSLPYTRKQCTSLKMEKIVVRTLSCDQGFDHRNEPGDYTLH